MYWRICCIILFPLLSYGLEVDGLLDRFQAAMARHGSITATLESRQTEAGAEHSEVVRGLLTWQGGANPRMRFTGARQQGPDSSTMLLLAIKDGEARVIDTSDSSITEAALTGYGGHLLRSRLSDDLLLLLYPALLDDLRTNPHTMVRVEDDSIRGKRIVLSVSSERSSFEIHWDADTYLPLYIERRSRSWRGENVRILSLERPGGSARPPVPETFELPTFSGYTPIPYTPSPITAGSSAPGFSVMLEGGEEFHLEAQRGRRVLLCFYAGGSPASATIEPFLAELGGTVDASQTVLLSLDMWRKSTDAQPRLPSPWLRANGDRLARTYGIDLIGVPAFFLINAEGAIERVFTGYIPGLTERAISAALLGGAQSEAQELADR